jgi:hypothetical protein
LLVDFNKQGGSLVRQPVEPGRGRLINPSELWKPERKVSEK